MKITSSLKYFFFIVLLTISCKEPFDPKISPLQSNYLVVEGYINAQGVTIITLSRTLPLKDSINAKPELDAQVTIAGEDNSVFEVRDAGDGKYISDSLVLNKNQKYRLHIKTISGGEYLSDYSAVKTTPAIDSISWKLENNGVRFYVDTHDPQNNTRYYKWDYEETWEIHSAYRNQIEYLNGHVRYRNYQEMDKLYYCWLSAKSASVLLGSSAQLSNDVISLSPLELVPLVSERLSVRYSILVKQHSLDRKAYDFYRLIKSNTESIGSVFDPLPSEITGNITCVSNPLEKVIGYITASTLEQKRIFVTSDEVQSKFSTNCEFKYVSPDSLQYYFDGGYLPFMSDGSPPGPVKGYLFSTLNCIDCTSRGTNIKPSFW